MEKTAIPITRLNSWNERLQSGDLKTINGRIIKYLYDSECSKTYNELSEALNIKHSSLTQPLNQLSKENLVLRDQTKVCTLSGRECIGYYLNPILLEDKKQVFSSN